MWMPESSRSTPLSTTRYYLEPMSHRASGICTSLPGFDRTAFHERFNAEVARFFQAKLR
jgi:hypothetical protein